MKNIVLVCLLASVMGCSRREYRDNTSDISGHWTGRLRAGDLVGFHSVTMDLNQYGSALDGVMTYESRLLKISGEAGIKEASLQIKEAGCNDAVKAEVRVTSLGLTLSFQGDTGCGLLSASGLVTH